MNQRTVEIAPVSAVKARWGFVLSLFFVVCLVLGALLLWKRHVFGPIRETGRNLLRPEVGLELGEALLRNWDSIVSAGTIYPPNEGSGLAPFAKEKFSCITAAHDAVIAEYGGGFHHFGLKILAAPNQIFVLQFYDEVEYQEDIGAEKVLAIWKWEKPADPVLLWSR